MLVKASDQDDTFSRHLIGLAPRLNHRLLVAVSAQVIQQNGQEQPATKQGASTEWSDLLTQRLIC